MKIELSRMPAVIRHGLFMAGILLLLAGCHSPGVSGSKNPDAVISGIEVIRHYPVMNRPGNKIALHSLDDTTTIVWHGEYVLYRLPGVKMFETDAMVEGSERYFLFRRDETSGIMFSLDKPDKRTSMPVDSFMKKYFFGSLSVGDNPMDSLVATDFLPGKEVFTERYIRRMSAPDGYFDSVCLVFDKRLHKRLSYSLSPYMDSSRNAKLVTIRLIYKAGFSKADQAVLPSREFVFAIRTLPDSLSKRYITLTEKWNEHK